MLQAWGLTPAEFGALAEEERLFIERSWNEQKQRHADKMRDTDGLPTQ